MTPSLALAELRDALKGHDIVASTLGRAPGQWVPVRREALATLIDSHWIVRPLGVVMAERLRAEQAGNGDGADRTAPQGTSGTVEKLILSPAENGADPAPAPTPTLCAECGTPLTLFEIEGIDQWKGTKFEALCGECCLLALGLL
jgi:hypothetical protein